MTRLYGFFLVCFSILFSSSAMIGQITGNVSDESGIPLIGVNVFVQGEENKGTTSDIDGFYSIDAQSGDSLVFSYIGFRTQTSAVAGSTINITLSEASELLDEVVVIGYGAVDKKDLTGVVTKVEQKDFNIGSLSSPDKLLNGKVAGMQIIGSGQPGGGSKIILRGISSISASSNPLFVIDGIPVSDNQPGRNPLNFLNTLDVESITVLKDASATAIYGSQGANGVIIVTTKTGRYGPLKIAYSGNVNSTRFSGKPDFLSTENFIKAIDAKLPQFNSLLGEDDTDWTDLVTQNTLSQEHNLNFSGGINDKVHYRVGLGLLDANGVLLRDKHSSKKFSIAVGSDKLLNERLDITLRNQTAKIDEFYAPNVFIGALLFDPTRPVKDGNEKFNGWYQWDDPLSNSNPVSALELNDNTGDIIRSLSSASIKLKITDNLTLSSNTSYDYSTSDFVNFSDSTNKGNVIAENGGNISNTERENSSLLQETYATYKSDLPGILSKIDLTLGHSWQEYNFESFTDAGEQIRQINGEMLPTTKIIRDSSIVTDRLIGFFGRVNFNYDERYLVTASLRRDGSTKFGEENRWGYFPAAAFAWRILQEDFAGGLNEKFTDLKLRVSWGVTGNQAFQSYLYETFYSLSQTDANYQFGDNYVRLLRAIGVDPNVQWEETRATNLGIDFGFKNNRYSGSLDLYQKKTNKLLFDIAPSAFTNLTDRITTNIGEMDNRGVELNLFAVAIDKENWDLGFNFNAAFNQNEIVRLDNADDPNFSGYESSGIRGDVGQTIGVIKVGEAIHTFRTYKHILEGGAPRNDQTDYNEDGSTDLLDMYEDLNNDGIINEDDLTPGKSPYPKFIFGLTTSLTYKDWWMSSTMRAHLGNYVYNNVASATGYFELLNDRGVVLNNIHDSAFENNFQTRQLKSDVYVENAAFFKLDNISIGRKFTNISNIEEISAYITASNILTITGYSGLDPELPQINFGIDDNIYPVSLNLLFGLSAKF